MSPATVLSFFRPIIFSHKNKGVKKNYETLKKKKFSDTARWAQPASSSSSSSSCLDSWSKSLLFKYTWETSGLVGSPCSTSPEHSGGSRPYLMNLNQNRRTHCCAFFWATTNSRNLSNKDRRAGEVPT